MLGGTEVIEIVHCARTVPRFDEASETWDKGCINTFERKTHNQKFCNSECTRLQTNANIMEKYYNNKRRKNGEVRICAECGITKLSQYNEENVCSLCEKKPEQKRSHEALRVMERLSRGAVTV